MGRTHFILFSIVLGMFVQLTTVYSGPAWAQTPAPGKDASSRVIRMVSIFDAMPGINTEDARMALELLLRNIMTNREDPFVIKLDFITDYPNAASELQAGRYDLVVLTGLDYLEFKPKVTLTPLMILSKVNQPTEPLVLVTQRGMTLAAIRKKSSRTLILEEGRAGQMAKIWLDTILMEEGLAPSELFFNRIRFAQKTSRSVLPVFFGQVEASVVTRNALDVMSELNPQIDTRLQVLKSSDGLIALLMCATPWANPKDVKRVTAEAADAMNDPKSRQALTIVQMERFFPFKSEYLEATQALYERYKNMMGHYKDP